MTVVDLFAGPGGWDCAAQQLGLDPIGFERDADACATRRAAGLKTIQVELPYMPNIPNLTGLIGSPPCPAFSAAGSQRGKKDIARIVKLLNEDSMGTWQNWVPMLEAQQDLITQDAMLLTEPLRWVQRSKPQWIALEQVPAVEPVWQAMGQWLSRLGYHVWSGVLNSADYGVAQKRMRAILIASLNKQVAHPAPTHSEFPSQIDMFSPSAQLQPWVTMGEALGLPKDWRVSTGMDWKDGQCQERALGEPAPTLTAHSGGQWRLNPGRTAAQPNRRLYELDEPAPTIAFGHDSSNWIWERPATTVTGDARIWPPGHKVNSEDIERLGDESARERYGNRAGTEAIRVTVEQAAALQSFPPDYPWQGGKTSKYHQVGNAVPVLLARAVLNEATS